MNASLPSNITFYRVPISEPEPQSQQIPSRPRRAASSAAADLDAASEPLSGIPKSQLVPIFGSVSTTDIADSIKAVLAETKDGARVVIGAEDVTILREDSEELRNQERGIEGDRIKALGNFRVEVRIKGGDPVVRTVSVQAQLSTQEQQ